MLFFELYNLFCISPLLCLFSSASIDFVKNLPTPQDESLHIKAEQKKCVKIE